MHAEAVHTGRIELTPEDKLEDAIISQECSWVVAVSKSLNP